VEPGAAAGIPAIDHANLTPGIKTCASTPAVTSPNGAMLRSNNWRRHTHWNKALKKIEPAPQTIHDLRHTYANLPRKSGADLRYVQKRWVTPPTVTANIYSDLYADELDKVAANLDLLHATEIHTHRRPKNRTNRTDNRVQDPCRCR
jgi:integrase